MPAGRARKLAVRDIDGAIADYSEALRLAPGTAALLVGRGHAHFVKGDTSAAIADFNEAIRLNPKSASTLNRRGLAYRRSGDLARAIDDYTAAIVINPIYALAYNNRGYVYEAQGRKDDAIADFQAALLLDPSLIGARDGLKRLGAPTAWVAESERRVQAGKALVEKNCSGCHAVGAKGESPNKKAPEFRNLCRTPPEPRPARAAVARDRRSARRDAEIRPERRRDRHHRRLHQQPDGDRSELGRRR